MAYSPSVTPLSQWPLHTPARIQRIAGVDEEKSRLLAYGLMEGLECRVLHLGPFGGNPIAIEVEGHMLTLRKSDAAAIFVEPLEEC